MKHAVLSLLLVPCLLAQGQWIRAEGSVNAMGSAVSVAVYGHDRQLLQSAVAQALEEVRRLEELLSNYRPESEWSQVNRYAADRPVRVSSELFDLLEACIGYSRASEGTFDITVGPLMRVWGFYKGSGHLPHRAEVRGALAKVGYRNILLDRKNMTVRFTQSGIEMDPGGIGKGYAVDKVAEVLRASGITSALISAGGSSLYAIGTPPGEAGWKVNIKDPKKPSQSIASVTLKDQSLSTSGNYEKFFMAEGKLWSHIMDPRTGFPSMGTLSVSLVTPRCIDSEAWAKPDYILGRDWTAKHKRKEFRVFYCEDKSDAPCAWLQ